MVILPNDNHLPQKPWSNNPNDYLDDAQFVRLTMEKEGYVNVAVFSTTDSKAPFSRRKGTAFLFYQAGDRYIGCFFNNSWFPGKIYRTITQINRNTNTPDVQSSENVMKVKSQDAPKNAETTFNSILSIVLSKPNPPQNQNKNQYVRSTMEQAGYKNVKVFCTADANAQFSRKSNTAYLFFKAGNRYFGCFFE